MTVISNPEWLNPYESWRQGVLASRGDYIFLAADDDIWDPQFVELLLAQHLRQDASLAFCNVREFSAAPTQEIRSYWSAVEENRAVLDDSFAGRRARFNVLVTKDLGVHRFAPDLFYAMYPADPLREIAQESLIWEAYGHVDERFIWATHSYIKPWALLNQVLLHRRVGNSRPNSSSKPWLSKEKQRLIFVRKMLLSPKVPLADKALIMLPVLVREVLRTLFIQTRSLVILLRGRLVQQARRFARKPVTDTS